MSVCMYVCESKKAETESIMLTFAYHSDVDSTEVLCYANEVFHMYRWIM